MIKTVKYEEAFALLIFVGLNELIGSEVIHYYGTVFLSLQFYWDEFE